MPTESRRGQRRCRDDPSADHTALFELKLETQPQSTLGQVNARRAGPAIRKPTHFECRRLIEAFSSSSSSYEWLTLDARSDRCRLRFVLVSSNWSWSLAFFSLRDLYCAGHQMSDLSRRTTHKLPEEQESDDDAGDEEGQREALEAEARVLVAKWIGDEHGREPAALTARSLDIGVEHGAWPIVNALSASRDPPYLRCT